MEEMALPRRLAFFCCLTAVEKWIEGISIKCKLQQKNWVKSLKYLLLIDGLLRLMALLFLCCLTGLGSSFFQQLLNAL